MNINLITLGCSKNLVDSEKLLSQLSKNGHTVYHNSDLPAELTIINTCGFILDAKTESIDTIFNCVQAKREGHIKKIFVMGCLSQRYKEALRKDIPEVDGFFGVWDQKEILAALQGEYFTGQAASRFITTPSHYAYLKISEGCNRNCAFCAIPDIRGKQISIPIEELLQEARFLASKGVKELILIAQDPSSYGTDLYKRKAFPELLERLMQVPDIQWVRLHYFHPVGFPVKEIIDLMKKYPRICRYLDIPVQHADNKILRDMNRGYEISLVNDIINSFRDEIPEICIRTTVMTGFPGEGKKEFETLKNYVREIEFDKLGTFSYSHEDDTIAFKNFKDTVPQPIKMKRMSEIMELQASISLKKNKAKIGRIFRVLIDKIEDEYYVGRTEFDSPEVDNEVLIPVKGNSIKAGTFCEVEITDATEHDIFGTIVN